MGVEQDRAGQPAVKRRQQVAGVAAEAGSRVILIDRQPQRLKPGLYRVGHASFISRRRVDLHQLKKILNDVFHL